MGVPTPVLSNFNRPFDALLQLQDDASAITVSTVGKVATVAKIVDLGDGVVLADAVFDINAIDVTTGDEMYLCKIEGSTSPTFASGIVTLAVLQLGGATANAVVGAESAASALTNTKRFPVAFRNHKYGLLFRYVRANFILSGTSPSLDAECYVSPIQTLGA